MSEVPSVYIAGPYVFYERGYTALDSMRFATEARGFKVSLPNDTVLSLDHEDLQKNGDVIFWNCADSMNASDTIICDLEFYRGFEPDGGSVYEIGMAYAKGARCYGFTRDLRNMVVKDPTNVVDGDTVRDAQGREYPYSDLPFCPSIVATTTLVEGDFADALDRLEWDFNRERVLEGAGGGSGVAAGGASGVAAGGVPGVAAGEGGRPRVYLAGPERYDTDRTEFYGRMRALGDELGLDVVSPLDDAAGVERIASEDPYKQAGNDFARWDKHVRGCDAIVANLSDYHGREPNSDTAFECGIGFQLGKKLFGYMDDTRIMLERIAHLGPEKEFRDQAGSVVENFNYPLNIMFASSMPIFEGDAAAALRAAAKVLVDGA